MDRRMLDRQIDVPSFTSWDSGQEAGRGAWGLLMFGYRITADAWAKEPQDPELHPEPSLCTHEQGGTGVEVFLGGLEAVDVRGLLSPPQGHPLQREILDVEMKGQDWWAWPRQGGLRQHRWPQVTPPELSGEFRVLSGTICLTKHRCLFKEETKHR